MTSTNTTEVISPTSQMINLILNAWTTQNKVISNFFDTYEDDFYLNPVAPGRNRAVYILGHLISSNDGLFELFGFGKRLYPKLEEYFTYYPDGAFANIPSVNELKQYWATVNSLLSERFGDMQPEQWLEKHTKVSEYDFALAPQRNKLNVILGRTSHTSYHAGQLIFLAERKVKA